MLACGLLLLHGVDAKRALAVGVDWPPTATGDPGRIASQDDASVAAPARSGWLLGGYGSSFLPVGRWADHPYAGRTIGGTSYDPGLDQFGPGFGGSVEIGKRWPRSVAVAAQFDLTTLGTSEWQAAAAESGSSISSYAMALGAHLLIAFELFRLHAWRMELRGGLGVLHIWGGEKSHDYDRSYDYDFLGPALSLRGGVATAYELSEPLDLVLLVDADWAVPGVEYAGGGSMPYAGAVVSLGPRIWLERSEKK